MSVVQGQFYKNKTNTQLFRICHVSYIYQCIAYVEWNNALNKTHQSKPLVMSMEDVEHSVIQKEWLLDKDHQLSSFITKSDFALVADGKGGWIKSRDKKYKNIQPLTNEEFIEKHLYENGIRTHVLQLIECSDWKSEGAFYNALNKYITFGMSPNALLPVGYAKCGLNFTDNKAGKVNIKRGRLNNILKKSGQLSENENKLINNVTRGITAEDKKNIERLIRSLKHLHKITYSYLYRQYMKEYALVHITKEVEGEIREAVIPMDRSDNISLSQFRYHVKKIFTPAEFLKLKHGNIKFIKDYSPKQGVARDGVVGATFQYEIDATIADIYVRDPTNRSEVSSLGRPTFYIVIDNTSSMITGFYLGFEKPNWAGAAEALLSVCEDKVKLAKKYGVYIDASDWPCRHLPVRIIADNGVEYTEKNISSLLLSEIGITGAGFAPIYQGNCKGTCERILGKLGIQTFTNESGGVVKEPRREDQHASNLALWDIESLTASLIEAIVVHNKFAVRDYLHTKDMAIDRIGITPNDIFTYSLKREMNGGNLVTDEDMDKIRWALLQEREATVRHDGILLDGLWYKGLYATEAGWYEKAKFHKSFKIQVKRSNALPSIIWYRNDHNEIITFELDRHKSGQFDSPRLEISKQTQYEYRVQKELQQQELEQQEAILAKGVDDLRHENYRDLKGVKRSTRKSPAKGVKDREESRRKFERYIRESDNAQLFGGSFQAPSTLGDDDRLIEEEINQKLLKESDDD
jgi:hypothetical protein